MRFSEFVWRCCVKATRSVYGIVGAASLALTLVGGAAQDQLPWTRPGWEYLAWVAPFTIGLALFIPALLRGAYGLYSEMALERDAVRERLAPFESRFNVKEQLGAHLYALNVLVRRFETWNEASGKESPISGTLRVLNNSEQYLDENVGLHYAARMYPFSAKQRKEIDLKNSYFNILEARTELQRITSELPD